MHDFEALLVASMTSVMFVTIAWGIFFVPKMDIEKASFYEKTFAPLMLLLPIIATDWASSPKDNKHLQVLLVYLAYAAIWFGSYVVIMQRKAFALQKKREEEREANKHLLPLMHNLELSLNGHDGYIGLYFTKKDGKNIVKVVAGGSSDGNHAIKENEYSKKAIFKFTIFPGESN